MAADLVAQTWDGVTAFVLGLDEVDLVRPTWCSGWAVVDVLVHLLGDAQRCLMACASPTDADPDLDAATYWSNWTTQADPVATARGFRFTRVQASAYRGTEGLAAHWMDTSSAAARAIAAHDPHERLQTQGHVLTAGDLGRTLVVEAAVHHLDCLLALPDAPLPDQRALDVVARTYAALCRVAVPATPQWALKGAGRLPLDDDDRELLGNAATRFPLLS